MFTNNEGIRYDNNCVWGSGKDLYPVEEDGNAVLADPKFTDTLGYTAGAFAMTAEGGKVTLGAADGFKLQDGSPCINAARDYHKCFVRMSVYHVCAWCPRRSEEGAGSSGIGAMMAIRHHVDTGN